MRWGCLTRGSDRYDVETGGGGCDKGSVMRRSVFIERWESVFFS